jgi:competence protein ComEC
MIRRPQVELVETFQGSPFWAALYTFKARAQATTAKILPEPYAALLTGILLGVETGIPRDLYDRFNATGTSHLIVISGFNKPVTQIDVCPAVQDACASINTE